LSHGDFMAIRKWKFLCYQAGSGASPAGRDHKCSDAVKSGGDIRR
jgi:hypothetical protein